MQKGEANGDAIDEDLPELASLSNRFSYFENFNEKEQKQGGADGAVEHGSEREMARRECKAKGVLNKFKEMENRVLNGEPEGMYRIRASISRIFLSFLQ